MAELLEIYCDGACIPNPGNGGWGFAVYRGGEEIHHEFGGVLDTTNNVMELTGMLMALRWLRVPENRAPGMIYCDSQYVVKGCMSWRKAWEKNGWKTRSGEAVKNLPLWQVIADLLDKHPKLPIGIEWVKGHAGHAGNERADELSMIGAAHAAGLPVEDLHEMERQMRAGEMTWQGKRSKA